ncbi:hypothetical protein KDW_04250 [Dictyobacter vulcani]|uniref:Uncharacterized protein n=1 Tax=Dictyobacter vulcani TaxID=2607529 RepID=A0A5J4KFA1_9CHLR|nr:hypothetical protein [Dictyobacter vulcani]GER86263.1 hypothetical protein KDW_04250 [Dictyobacter vulcani]
MTQQQSIDTSSVDTQQATAKISQDLEAARPFYLERYRYILQQTNALNENGHKYLALFQTLATVIIGAGITLFLNWRSWHIMPEQASSGMQTLLGLLIIDTLFVVISLLSGIFSWLDYRREETVVLKHALGESFREPPRFRNFWRWYETYMILFILIFVIIIIFYVESQFIPQIH